MDVGNTTALGKLVGTFCHMSQAWSFGKTLLWPLYMLLKDYREVTPEGKLRYRQAQVKLGYDAAAALMEWYERINVCGIYKKFYSCNGTHWTTTINIWCGRNYKVFASGKKSTKGVKDVKGSKTLELSSPLGKKQKARPRRAEVGGVEWSKQTLVEAIQLLFEFLQEHAADCGDIISVKTNVGAFARYISKDCYPAGLGRPSYVRSVSIQRLLSKPGNGENRENRMMHPRQLKAWYIM